MAVREPADETTREQVQRGREEARRIGSDVAEIAADLRDLAAAEARLAGAEARESVTSLTRGAMWGAIAAVHAVIFAAFVFITIMFVLNIWLPLWASALITTGIILVLTAAVGGLAYRAFQRFSIVPERTIDSVKEDMRWLISQARSNGR